MLGSAKSTTALSGVPKRIFILDCSGVPEAPEASPIPQLGTGCEGGWSSHQWHLQGVKCLVRHCCKSYQNFRQLHSAEFILKSDKAPKIDQRHLWWELLGTDGTSDSTTLLRKRVNCIHHTVTLYFRKVKWWTRIPWESFYSFSEAKSMNFQDNRPACSHITHEYMLSSHRVQS